VKLRVVSYTTFFVSHHKCISVQFQHLLSEVKYIKKIIYGELRSMKIKPTKTLEERITKRRIRGQGMTEYIIILALIALAAVVTVGLFGDTVQSQFAAMGHKLTGGSGAASVQAGATQAGTATGTIAAPETLGTYAN